MPDRTLLIPGTQATSLADQDGTVVYNAVRVSLGLQKDDLGGRPPGEWQALLSMEHAPGSWEPTRTSLLPGVEIRAASVVGTPYDRMLAFSEPWPYDWRADIRHNGRLLLRYLRQNKPVDSRWNLVGHSQGGLVIVAASALTSSLGEFGALVARAVLVGAPLAGTMRATEALLWGSEDLGEEHVAAARGMARTWPALYQMLPSWNAVVDPDGRESPAEQQLVRREGWPGPWGTGIQVDHLARARELQGMLHGPFSRMAGVATMAVLGNRHLTPVTMTRDGDALPGDRKSMARQKGDTLVPYRRTLEWGGRPYADRVLAFTGRVERHAMLCADEDVVDATRRFLSRPAPPPSPSPS
jgi:pimeloyl-ACP methyl ester carboxylesterase